MTAVRRNRWGGGITNTYAVYVTVVVFLTIGTHVARNKQYQNYYIIMDGRLTGRLVTGLPPRRT
jgi:hypothetical protein